MPDLAHDDWPEPAFLAELSRINQEKIKIEDLRNALGHLEQLYSQDVHLAYELVQNADDAGASELVFELSDTELRSTNNGRPFIRGDLHGICRVPPHSGKSAEKGGRFGIGFRSVYKITDQPRIVSGWLDFDVLERFVPAPRQGMQRFSARTSVYLPLNIAAQRQWGRFRSDLFKRSPRTLLFLNYLQRIRLCAADGLELTLERRVEPHEPSGGTQIHLLKDSKLVETWVVFHHEAQGATIPFDIAIQLDRSGDVMAADECFAFVLLPTEQRTGFPFLFQARFETPRHREKLEENDANEKALRAIGRALPQALQRLKRSKGEPRHLLAAFPTSGQEAEPVFEPLTQAALVAGRRTKLAPAEGNKWSRPGEAVLLPEDDEKLRTLLSPDDLTVMFGSRKDLVHLPKTPRGRSRQVLRELGVEVLTPSHLLAFLRTPQAFEGRDVDWFRELYSYLWRHHRELNLKELGALPLIRCSDGQARRVDKCHMVGDARLAADLATLLGARVRIVDPEVIRARPDRSERPIRDLLEWLGMQSQEVSEAIDTIVLPALDETAAQPEAEPTLNLAIVDFLRKKAPQYISDLLRRGQATSEDAGYERLGKRMRLLSHTVGGSSQMEYHPATLLFLGAEYAPASTQVELASSVAGVRVLDLAYLRFGSASRAEWVKFFGRIGVDLADQPEKIIDRVILPRYSGSEWTTLDANTRLTDLVYLRRNFRAYMQARNASNPTSQAAVGRDLASKLWVRTRRVEQKPDGGTTTYYDRPFHLYFPPAARTQVNAEKTLPTLAVGQFLHDQYFDEAVQPQDGELRWVDFFELLGVRSRPRISTTTDTPYSHQGADNARLNQHPGIKEAQAWPTRIIREHEAPDLAKALTELGASGAEIQGATATRIYDALARGWQEEYSQSLQATYLYKPRKHYGPEASVQSRFGWMLTQHAWVPTTQGLKRPSSTPVYLDRPEFRELVGDDLPFLSVDDPGPSGFYTYLGVKDRATLDDVLSHLRALASAAAPLTDGTIRIYEYLRREASESAVAATRIREAFRTEPLIAAGRTSPDWRPADGVLWQSNRKVFGDYRPGLSGFYPTALRGFFIDAGVEGAATSETYFSFLEELAAASNVPNLRDTVTRVYQALAAAVEEGILRDRDELEDSLELLTDPRERLLLYCGERGFRSVVEVAFVDDLTETSAAFDGQVPLLKLSPGVPLPALLPFFRWLGVPTVSESVVRRLCPPESPAPDREWTERIRFTTLFLRRWLWHQAPRVYGQAKPLLQRLTRAEVMQVSALQVEYYLGERVALREVGAFLDEEATPPVLYHLIDGADPAFVIGRELASTLGAQPGLDEYLQLLIMQNPEVADRYLTSRGMGPVPSDEDQWLLIPADEDPEADPNATGTDDPLDGSTDDEPGSDDDDEVGQDDDERSSSQGGRGGHRVDGQGHRGQNGQSGGGSGGGSGRGESNPGGSDGGTGAGGTGQSGTGGTGASGSGSGSGSRGTSDPYRKPVLRSFVPSPRERESERHPEQYDHRQGVGNVALQFVLQHERNQQRDPENVSEQNVGWDVSSEEPDLSVRRIEVKGLSGAWDGFLVELTPNEFREAVRFRDTYWLYVVENALTEPRLYTIRNPAYRTGGYLFDGGWRELETTGDDMDAGSTAADWPEF